MHAFINWNKTFSKGLDVHFFQHKSSTVQERTLDMETGNPDFRTESKMHTNALLWMRHFSKPVKEKQSSKQTAASSSDNG